MLLRLLTGILLTAIDSLNWGTSFLNTMISMQVPKGAHGRSDNSDSSLTANIGDFINLKCVENQDGQGETDRVASEGEL